jgi:hypothetical protein
VNRNDDDRRVPHILGVLCLAIGMSPGQSLHISPQVTEDFAVTPDTAVPSWSQPLGITVLGADKLDYTYVGPLRSTVQTVDFAVVSPSTGVAPAVTYVSLNPYVVPYLRRGTYTTLLQFAMPGQTQELRTPSPSLDS